MRSLVALLLSVAFAWPVYAETLSGFLFIGRKVDLPAGKTLTVNEEINPGDTVLFDLSNEEQVILRRSALGEVSTDERPLFRFEWGENGRATLFALHSEGILANLEQQHTKDIANSKGKGIEEEISSELLKMGQAIGNCLSSNVTTIGTIEMYVVVDALGAAKQSVVVPEGGAAQCLETIIRSVQFQKQPGGFTAKVPIRVKE